MSIIKRSNKKWEKNYVSKEISRKSSGHYWWQQRDWTCDCAALPCGRSKGCNHGRDQKSIDTALKTLSTDSLGFAGDASSLKDLETFMVKVNERFGRIDTLFVNAGVASNGPTPVATASEDEFDRVFAINTKGAFFTVQKALPYMPKGSTIVFCTSIVDRLSIATPGVYSASKA